MGTAASVKNKSLNKSKSWVKPATRKKKEKKKLGRAQTAPENESGLLPAKNMDITLREDRKTEIFLHNGSSASPSPSHLAIRTAEQFDPKAGANVVNHIVNAGFVFLEPGARIRRVGSFLDEAELAHQSAQEKSVRRSRRKSTEISESMVGIFLF